MGKRPLTLTAVPAEMIAEFGLQSIVQPSYRCDETAIELIGITRVLAPQRRMLNEAATRSILKAVADGSPMPPVDVVREIPDQVTLLDGMHRYVISLQLGFPSIPCRVFTEVEAADKYGYAPRMNPQL